MNDEQKQIEEMAQAIFDYVDTKNMGSVYICGNKAIEEAKPFLHNTGIAEFMYRRGYRKQSDTVREILQKLIYNITANNTNDGYLSESIDYSSTIDDIKELAAQYGVEVK